VRTRDAVVFDVDGTLAETERDGHRVAFNRAFAEAGLPWQWDERLYGELLAVTGGRERIAHYARRFAPQWLSDDRAGERIAALHRRKNEHYAEIVEAGELQLRPGVARLLEELGAAGVRLAIATTTSRTNLDVLLQATLGTAAMERFEVVVCGEDVSRKKPDPEAYALALWQLRLPATRCLAVEDSANGLRAALAAGISTVIVRSLYTRDEDFRGALQVFDGFAAGPASAVDGHHLTASFIASGG
jgi:HAD superfamily hydrolase (TIGR01509 family)